MVFQERLYTNKEFWEISQLPENQNKRLELMDGVIHDMASSSKKILLLRCVLARVCFYTPTLTILVM